MKTYTVTIHDKEYSSWDIYEVGLPDTKIQNIDPIKHKLFSKDTFFYENETVTQNTSPVRSGKKMAGVLLLENNKTFGRTKNKKRLLYRCIPYDRELPTFLIPYEPAISFSKIFKNKYVLFVFDNWEGIHPHGRLEHVIGDVDILENYYDYCLYSKELNTSLKNFTQKIQGQLNKKTVEEYTQEIQEKYGIEDRRHIPNIFSIDGENCTDIDDAFSIQLNDDYTYTISIYIANVVLWIDVLDAWNVFTDRVSTIYLPHKKYGMLPNILSDDVCSLREGCERVAFALDIIISAEGKIQSFSFKNVFIRVFKNYVYDEPCLCDNPDYILLLQKTGRMSEIKNSRELVSFWMIKMNTICGEHMYSAGIGIFRTTEASKNVPIFLNEIWDSYTGKYVKHDIVNYHANMKIHNYIHITSPIRRLVDLLNQLSLVSTFVSISSNSTHFLENWILKLEELNGASRTIKKIQTNCELLNHFYKVPNIIGSLHKGIIFDKKWVDGLFVYSVYLEEYRLFTHFKTMEDLENYTRQSFLFYLFEGEHHLKRKIRVQHFYTI